MSAGVKMEFRAFCILWKKQHPREEEIIKTIKEEVDHSVLGKWYMVSDAMGRNKTALALYGHRFASVTDEDLFHRIVEILEKVAPKEYPWFWGIGDIVQNPEDLKHAYEQAEEASSALSYRGYGKVAVYKDKAIEFRTELDLMQENLFLKLLMDKDIDSAIRRLKIPLLILI